jgi:hypothetical protein
MVVGKGEGDRLTFAFAAVNRSVLTGEGDRLTVAAGGGEPVVACR